MWGDFCKKKYDDDGNDIGLELNTCGYDMTDPNVEVPMTKKTIIPDPETHFSFSTKLMVLAIDLYQNEAPRGFCPYTNFAYKKLTQFVDSRKDMTAQSYRFFVEHAYNQLFQHEAFHQSARARTKAKDLGAGEFHTSAKLDGCVWLANTDKMVHVPKDQADDVNIDDDDYVEEEVEFLPTVEVIVRLQEKTKKEDDVSSQEREEASQQAGHSEQTEEIPELDVASSRSPEERYGIYIMRQLKTEYRELLRDMAFNSQNIPTRDDREGEEPLGRDQIGNFAMVLMMEFLISESHKSFMELFAPWTGTDITDEQYHEFRLELKKLKNDNKHLHPSNFEDVDEPDLMDDPSIPLELGTTRRRRSALLIAFEFVPVFLFGLESCVDIP